MQATQLLREYGGRASTIAAMKYFVRLAHKLPRSLQSLLRQCAEAEHDFFVRRGIAHGHVHPRPPDRGGPEIAATEERSDSEVSCEQSRDREVARCAPSRGVTHRYVARSEALLSSLPHAANGFLTSFANDSSEGQPPARTVTKASNRAEYFLARSFRSISCSAI